MRVTRLAASGFLIGAVLGFSAIATARAESDLTPGFFDNSHGSPIVTLIDQAQSQVDIEIYEMDDPKVIAAIRRAIQRGVTFHIVKEPKPVGASCRVFEEERRPRAVLDSFDTGGGGDAASCADQRKLVKQVIAAGGTYVPFKKPDLCGAGGTKSCLEHGKIVVADSKLALVTTGNFNTSNLCDIDYHPKTCNRDYTVLTDDADVVKTLTTVVRKDTQGRHYDVSTALTPGAERKITVGPDSLDPMVSFIRSARRRIQIENQYLKEPTINAALIKAAKSGIEVEVMVASACSFGKPRPTEAKRLTAIYSSFDKAGIRTRVFNKKMLIKGRNGYLHAKAILIDGVRAWVGSVNGSTQATTLNREFGVFVDDPDQVAALGSYLEYDFTHPQSETWRESLNCAENH